jgi:signal transduction histidine kinase
MRRPVLLLGVAGVGLGVAAESVAFEWSDPGHWIPDLVTGWTLIGCGMIAWNRRPESRTGALLAATGFTWFFGNFLTVGGVVGWIAGQSVYLHRGPLFHGVIAYPSASRVTSLLALGTIVLFYAVAVVPAIWSNETGAVVLAALFVAVVAAGYVRAVGPIRRARLISLQAAAGLGVVIMAGAIARLLLSGPDAGTVALLAYETTLCAVAIGMTAGLLSAASQRADVTDLVVELGATRSRTLEGELARALGDPSVEVGYWHPDQHAFVDAEGRALTLPTPDADRAATIVEREHEPVAVLVHDPVVLQDPGVMEAVTSAARLEASNARLQAEVKARVTELEASRRRVLEARDEERRRLELRLHEGAERRLRQLGDVLRRSRTSSYGGETELRIARAEERLTETLEDLSRLGRGLHPRGLSERGLESALTGLVEAFPIPVRIRVPHDRLPLGVELVAYFVCSEALANVAKHASASHAAVTVMAGDERAVVEIEDDGSGGVDVAAGTGLRNLVDRVEAFGGTLDVVSASGRGTRLTAEIPLGGEAS